MKITFQYNLSKAGTIDGGQHDDTSRSSSQFRRCFFPIRLILLINPASYIHLYNQILHEHK